VDLAGKVSPGRRAALTLSSPLDSRQVPAPVVLLEVGGLLADHVCRIAGHDAGARLDGCAAVCRW